MILKIISTGTEEYEQMIRLRLDVLLEPIGIPLSYINPEKEKDDLLIAAFDHDKLMGCCVLTRVNEETIQLRQMAVATDVQHKGVGKAIIAFAEKMATENGYTFLMMHARDSVLSFYEKCGYTIAGEQFWEVGIPHHKMVKMLNAKG